MCLTKVNKKLDEPKKMQFYKVMYRVKRPGKKNLYYFKIRADCNPLEKGAVKHATIGEILLNDIPDHEYDPRPYCVADRYKYKAGFHGYTGLSSAKFMLRYNPSWGRHHRGNIRKYHGYAYKVVVLCEGLVHTIGSEGSSSNINNRGKKKVVVASTMKILKEIPLTQLYPGKVRIR